MLVQKVCIEDYVPFQNSGNKHVEFQPTEPGVAILGSNGAGKSSLLRLLSPFPASRPDFGKKGKYEMTVSHDGHIYDIASNFESSSAPCSFKKDGTELNPSGTGDVQKDLVEAEFGLVPHIWDILSGKVQVCSMQKAHRKTLFSSHYPSDLTFILEYHKKVCSQIRAYGNQLKLLQSREGEYRASLMDPAEIKRLEEYRETALEVISRIDKANLLLEAEIDRLRQEQVMRKPYVPSDLDHVIEQFESLRNQYIQHMLDGNKSKMYGETISREKLSLIYAELNSELVHLEQQRESVTNNLREMRDELNKFTNLKTSSSSDQRTTLVNELTVVKAELDSLREDKTWQDRPVIPLEVMKIVIDLEPSIRSMIAQLHSYAGSLLEQRDIDRLNNEIRLLDNSVITLEREHEDLLEDISRSESRLVQLTANSYPEDCTRTCALRATVEGAIRDVRLRMDTANGRRVRISKQLKEAEENLAAHKKKLEDISSAMPIVQSLQNVLTENYLGEMLLNGETLIDCLNTKCSTIENNLRSSIEASKKFHRFKRLNDRYEQISRTISMMETVENSQMSAEVISGIIADKERKIRSGMDKLEQIDATCSILVGNMDRLQDMGSILKTLDDLTEKVGVCLNIRRIRNRIEFDQEMIKEHNKMRGDLSYKLREIERTLGDQKKLSDILNSETLPQLELIKRKKKMWEAVESGLSPSRGLPCIYLVRFINKLISIANSYIKEVWCHDMELVYLNEEDELDFTLSVMMNKSTIVKDISLCSKGEQSMIDLAMTLAICVERGYLEKYPIKLDEIDSALTEEHRSKLINLLGSMLEEGVIKQMFLVNHFAAYTGISKCECLVLSPEGIVTPAEYNKNAVIW